jgi:acyl transferase domain-containing protein/acyl-CoA synthetase (AMP-forming)/AMP-acid ligase II/acyl carrier protein
MIRGETSVNASTIIGVLCGRALYQPDRLAYVFLRDGKSEGARLTYDELERDTRALAAYLASTSAAGERALLIYPPGLEFIIAFFACLRANLIAVPSPLPEPGRLKRTLPRLEAITRDSNATLALTTEKTLPMLRESWQGIAAFRELQIRATDKAFESLPGPGPAPEPGGKEIAYLQYTSGSTREPRGVMTSHENIMQHSATLRKLWGHKEDSLVVNWLPHFHDFALIDGIIQPLYSGIPSYIMSPLAFLKHPCRWLEAISRYGATHSQAPNFAYDLSVSATTPEQRAALDLSRWRMAGNGSEMVRLKTIESFTRTFACSGLRREALCPGYGLAEATLVVSAKRQRESLRHLHLDASALEKNQILEIAGPGSRIINAVSCGKPVDGVRVVVVDPRTHMRAPEDMAGELWIAGPSVAGGYWERPDETRMTFQAYLADTGEGPFLRTGDLGFLKDGELYITGRLKDLMIINGLNHHAQDVEYTLEACHPLIRKNRCAAFSITIDEEERPVVLVEIEERSEEFSAIVEAIRSALAASHDLDLHGIVLLRKGAIPRTSSGKIQRQASRAAFLSGDLRALALGEWVKPGKRSRGGGRGTAPRRGGIERLGGKKGEAEIQNWLIALLAGHLQCSPETIDIDEPFAHHGFSSKDAVAFVGHLEDWIRRALSPSLFWHYPDIRSLAGFLAGAPGTESRTCPAPSQGTCPDFAPCAIVGMACRFPGGADDPEKFWSLLRRGADAITDLPPERRALEDYCDPDRSAPGKMYTCRGGYLASLDLFDPLFFGISEREAESMDPQQRLLLEVVWEALEGACQDWARLKGSATGVFIAISTSDYRDLLAGSGHYEAIDTYFPTGVTAWGAAGRISYVLGLRGPSMAIDTACSSSLVALDAACQSLETGRCRQAIVGGVNLILSPLGGIAFSRIGALSPDGRCRAFDSEAEGYGRSEGCGALIVKRLSDARADGDNVLAVIRGSAVNHNGRRNGLTAPDANAQIDVIRRALAEAGVHPSDVGYVEAHGSGTVLGDLIELEALRDVMSERPLRRGPLMVGSVKTNIGHMEAAAGMGGIIKTVLALVKGEIPPHIHFRIPHPHLDWKKIPLEVPVTVTPWPPGRKLAGVSSFGFSGVNAHVILEEAPRESAPRRKEKVGSAGTASPHQILVLSARGRKALGDLAGRYEAFLSDNPRASLADIAYSAAVGRHHLPERLSLVISSPGELGARLGEFRKGEASRVVGEDGVMEGRRPGIAFLFTGQSSQHRNMGRELFESQPVFRHVIERCDSYLRHHCEKPLIEALYPPMAQGASKERPEALAMGDLIGPGRRDAACFPHAPLAPAALFSVEIALLELWRSWGIRPTHVLGHSLGEYAASCAAGIFSVEDGLRLIMARGRLARELCQAGEMATIFAGDGLIKAIISINSLAKGVSIAAINGPEIVTVAGDPDAMKALRALLDREPIRYLGLNVSHAFHSPHMKPMAKAFRKVAEEISFSRPEIPIIANLTGDLASKEMSSADYWCRHLSETVKFSAGVQWLCREGIETFLEIGPDPVLLGLVQSLPGQEEHSLRFLPSLRQGVPDTVQMLQGLGSLYTAGAQVDWEEVHRNSSHRKIALPTYPFQRRRFWFGRGPGREALPERLDEWLYEVKWEPSPVPGPRSGPADPACGLWIIMAEEDLFCSSLASHLKDEGHRCAMAFRGPSYRGRGDGAWVIDPSTGEHFRQFFADAVSWSAAPLRGIIHCWGISGLAATESDSLPESVDALCAGLLHTVQMLAGRSLEAPLWIVTGGAVSREAGSSLYGLAQSPLWAMGKVISQEHPNLWGGMVDLAPSIIEESAPLVIRELHGDGEDDHIAYSRDGQRSVARLARLPCAGGDPWELSPDASYLVTGGLGGLGKMVVKWMAAHGARHLVLTGRSAVRPEEGIFFDELRGRGMDIIYHEADAASIDDMQRLSEEIDRNGIPLRGVIHAAGVFDYRLLAHMDIRHFAPLLIPKVQGAWNLHRITEGRRLDFFMLFSSAASVAGGRGLGHYAAANAFLDALARFRKSLGLAGLSINWGPWEGSAMGTGPQEREMLRFSRVGVGLIRAGCGLEILGRLFGRVLSGRVPGLPAQICVYPVEWPIIGAHLPPGRQRSFFSRLLESPRSPSSETSGSLLSRLKEAPRDRWEGLVASHVGEAIAAVMRLDSPRALDPARHFFELGMDSLMTLELRSRISRSLGISLPSSVLMRHATIEKLVMFLLGEVSGKGGPDGISGGSAPPLHLAFRLSASESCRHVKEIMACLSSEDYVQQFSEDYIRAVLTWRRAILVYDADELIGFTFWEPLEFRIKGRTVFALLTAFLKKPYRGRHIGAKLIYLRNEYLVIDENLLVQSIFDERLKKWALRSGFRKVAFNHFGPDFLRYYCDCMGDSSLETCAYRDGECELIVHFPGDAYTPSRRPGLGELEI